jgi:uncharacterized protein YfaS (alpha-2-macroglobulin family)
MAALITTLLLVGRDPQSRSAARPVRAPLYLDRASADPTVPARIPLYPDPVPAQNPTQLTVLVDPGKVLGWIGGTRDLAGQEVRIRAGGSTKSARVAAGNTFTWNYRVTERSPAEITVAGLERRVTLNPPATLPPSAFFIVDRPVYRLNQTLQFAAYLRQPDAQGEFMPLAGRAVEVQLTSQQKKTTATKMKLTSDDSGRIAGCYTFVEADPLDTYELTIPGFKGSAHVALAEYRKSKIKLRISGERDGDQVRLRFEALDFLEQPVAGSKVQFTAQVVRNPARTRSCELKAAEFVYAADIGPVVQDLEDLDEDHQLLMRSGLPQSPFLGAAGASVVSQVQGEVRMAGKEAAEHILTLPRRWKEGRHAVVVQGVLIDANGHEQRASQTIPLELRDDSLRLTLAKDVFGVNEPIRVTARSGDKEALEGSATLVALRLSPNPVAGAFDPYSGYLGNSIQFTNMGYIASPYAWGYGRHLRRLAGEPGEVEEPLRRTMVTATAFQGNSATLRLSEPGAYKLVAIVERPDGSKLRQEVGCVVHGAEDRPALTLQLDRTAYEAGEHLRGAVHSRYADARVLVTVRDSQGYRAWKTLQLTRGIADLDLELPAECLWGCYVDVQYTDSEKNDEPAHVASRLIHVHPTSRLLTIETKVKPVVAPGDRVALDLQVNRKAAVDLVVSVYDQALLGIRADRSVDPASFYLADDRVRQGHDREILRRRLGGVTLGQLLDKARRLLKQYDEGDMGEEPAALRILLRRCDGREPLQVFDAGTLLRLAGVKLQPLTYWYNGYQWLAAERIRKDPVLADLLDAESQGWSLKFWVVGETVVMAEHHTSWGANYVPYLYGYRRGAYDGFINSFNQGFAVSGNSAYSVSGQAMFSHGPVAPVATPLEVGHDQAGVAVRRDFSDSAYWSALVRTDAEGKARVEFKVPDSLTNWQVVVTAISKDLHVGRGRAHFQTFKPVMVWPMLPRVFTEGDRVDVFASVHNRSEVEQTLRVRLKVENGDVLTPAEREITLAPRSNGSVYWTFRPGKAGFTQLLMSAECPAGSDASLKRLPVLRASAEQVVTASGFCKDAAEVKLPEGVDPAAASLEIHFAPSLAADLVDTLDYLVEYPYGCVEQTMSRFLPAIQVAKVLQRYQIHHEALNRKLPGCVQGGIKRLLELQQPDGGWGWNGNGQTHEMMTPYALYGLLQAEKAGYTLSSEQAVERGLVRLRQFIDQMGAGQAADRVFCMYVYSHRKGILPEWWKFLEEELQANKLSDYALALSLEMAVQNKKQDLADRLARRLRERAETVNGLTFWQTAGFSRWGDDRFEISAAALKALAAFDVEDPLIPGVLGFFAATKRGKHWNSTKDTAMIVYAMCDYLSRKDVRPEDRPHVAFRCNDGPETPAEFVDRTLSRKVVVTAAQIRAGSNRIVFTDGSAGMMYRLVLRYRKEGRDLAASGHGVRVNRTFWLLDDKGNRQRELKSGDTVPRGAYLESLVQANHLIGQPMHYVLVENPKPSCCEILPADDRRFHQECTPFVLREEREGQVVYHHEMTPQTLTDRSVLHAELAGEYVVAPARLELMYHAETTGHSGSFVLRVTDEAR